jgi:hypothetical protein
LPFGHGRQFSLHGPLDQIAGGWRVSTLFQWHGGVPFTPVIQSSVQGAVDPGLSSSTAAGSYLYPAQIGDPRVSTHSVVPISSSTHFGIGGWFNPAAYSDPAYGTFGSNIRNTVIGPGFSDVDLSVGKEFRIREGMSLEIRADAYNAFNHVNFANPDANVGYTCSSTTVQCGPSNSSLADTTAGTITGPAGGVATMRIMQLGAHFRF